MTRLKVFTSMARSLRWNTEAEESVQRIFMRRFHQEYRPPQDSPYEYRRNRNDGYGGEEPPEYSWSISLISKAATNAI